MDKDVSRHRADTYIYIYPLPVVPPAPLIAVSCRVFGLTVTTLAVVPRFEVLAMTLPPWVVMLSTRPPPICPGEKKTDKAFL